MYCCPPLAWQVGMSSGPDRNPTSQLADCLIRHGGPPGVLRRHPTLATPDSDMLADERLSRQLGEKTAVQAPRPLIRVIDDSKHAATILGTTSAVCNGPAQFKY